MAREVKASEAKPIFPKLLNEVERGEMPKRQRQAANDWLGYTFYTQPERRLPVRC